MRRRRPTKLGIIGSATGGLGVIFLAWGSAQEWNAYRVGVVLVLFGTILICHQRLERKNLAADEIFNLGRERGEADAYDEGYRDGLAEGERGRPRPVVVPFPPQTCSCGNSSALQPVGSVADRG